MARKGLLRVGGGFLRREVGMLGPAGRACRGSEFIASREVINCGGNNFMPSREVIKFMWQQFYVVSGCNKINVATILCPLES